VTPPAANWKARPLMVVAKSADDDLSFIWNAMPAIPSTADIHGICEQVCLVPTADLTQILLANGLPLVRGKWGVIQLLLGSVTTAR
jgi:hypothetical protein